MERPPTSMVVEYSSSHDAKVAATHGTCASVNALTARSLAGVDLLCRYFTDLIFLGFLT